MSTGQSEPLAVDDDQEVEDTPGGGSTPEGEQRNPYIMRLYWYPISFTKDLHKGEVAGLHILGDPIVLFRDGDGVAACLADICAHRSAPLSIGRVMDGKLECKYHGWQYDADGKVIHIPALLEAAKVPANAKSYKYPTIEKDGIIWVWPGPKELADESKVPDLVPGERMHTFGDPFQIAVDLDIDHTLMCENLLDPAHLPFTHEGTLSKREKAGPLRMEVEVDPQHNVALKGTLTAEKRKWDAETTFEFIPPCTIRLSSRFKKTWRFQQVMHCVPTRPGHMRLMYQHNRNFLVWLDSLPFMKGRNEKMSKKIIFQDYELLHGQQVRLRQGGGAWNSPIQVDKLPKMYRNWIKKALKVANPWFKGFSKDVEDLCAASDASTFMPQAGGCLITACDVYSPSDGDVIIPKQRGVDNSAYYMTANPRPTPHGSRAWGLTTINAAALVVVFAAASWMWLSSSSPSMKI